MWFLDTSSWYCAIMLSDDLFILFHSFKPVVIDLLPHIMK